jgi:hypothetical protein
LDEFGLKLAGDELVPSVDPEAVAAPKPVLIVTRKVSIEARGHWRHVRFSFKEIEV